MGFEREYQQRRSASTLGHRRCPRPTLRGTQGLRRRTPPPTCARRLDKAPAYNDEEIEGFRGAAKTLGVRTVELINFGETGVRLSRLGQYRTLRGTFLELTNDECLLYTRGSVDFFQTYPGQYIPNPSAFIAQLLNKQRGSMHGKCSRCRR